MKFYRKWNKINRETFFTDCNAFHHIDIIIQNVVKKRNGLNMYRHEILHTRQNIYEHNVHTLMPG